MEVSNPNKKPLKQNIQILKDIDAANVSGGSISAISEAKKEYFTDISIEARQSQNQDAEAFHGGGGVYVPDKK